MAKLTAQQEKFARDAYRAAYSAGLRGVQADLAVAQAALESAWGTDPSGANNVHGIKGKTGTVAPTKEVVGGKMIDTLGTFLDFDSLTDSFRSWKDKVAQKWSGVVHAKTLEGAVKALKAGQPGGYATLPAADYEKRVSDVAGLTSKFSPDQKTKEAYAEHGASRAAASGKLSAKQRSAVDTLHPDVRDRAAAFLGEANRRGLNLNVVQTVRTEAQQAGLYAQGRTAPGSVVTYKDGVNRKSPHQSTLAFDVVPADLQATKNWSPEDPRWDQIGALANEFGFEWGGDWKNFKDKPHIQVNDINNDALVDIDGDGFPDLSPLDSLDARKGKNYSPPIPDARPNVASALSPQQAAEIASAYNDPSRALDAPNSVAPYGGPENRPMPSGPVNMPSPARIDNLAYAGPKGHFSVKPSASDLLGLTGPQRTNPGARPGLSMPSRPTRPDNMNVGGPKGNFSVPGPASLAASPAGQVTRSALGDMGDGMVSAPAPGRGPVGEGLVSGPVGSSVANGTSFAGRPAQSLSAAPRGAVERGPALSPASFDPRGNQVAPALGHAASVPSPANFAEQYGQYRSPTSYAGVRNQAALDQQAKAYAEMERNRALALAGLPAPRVPAAPVPALAPPAPTVAAPPLAPPTVVKNYPVYQATAAPAAPPAPPAARAYDVYSGMARSALDNTGMNTVGRLADGTTTVTNQYGKTTGMTPGGYQTAVGAISGPLGQGGIQAPEEQSQGGFFSKAGSTAKGFVNSPVTKGAAMGATVGGIPGAVIGGLLGAAMRPGGLLSGSQNVNTAMANALGHLNGWNIGPTTAFHNPVAGGHFPGAPSNPGTTRGFKDSATRDHAYGMSPGAAAAIDKGLGGLY